MCSAWGLKPPGSRRAVQHSSRGLTEMGRAVYNLRCYNQKLVSIWELKKSNSAKKLG